MKLSAIIYMTEVQPSRALEDCQKRATDVVEVGNSSVEFLYFFDVFVHSDRVTWKRFLIAFASLAVVEASTKSGVAFDERSLAFLGF